MNKTEHIILSSLLSKPKFADETLGMINASFFEDEHAKFCFTAVKKYYEKYGKTPNSSELEHILIKNKRDKDQEFLNNSLSYSKLLSEEVDDDFAYDTTEEYCKYQATYLALHSAMNIIENKEKDKPLASILDMMDKAVNFSFATDLGLDYYEDIERRENYYIEDEHRVAFKNAMMNKITNGGVSNGTLNIVTAPTGFGKSIFMADEAYFQSYTQGKNVCYYTFEMSDMRISNRIDANHLDISVNDVIKYKANLKSKFTEQRERAKGKLILKEFSPQSQTALDIASHIKQTETKYGIKVDIVYVDYINLMASYNSSKRDNSYERIKLVCEELIAKVAKKFDIPVMSATQVNRQGQNNTNVSIVDIAESQGLSNTADFLVVFYDNDEYRNQNKAFCRQLKNRYGDTNYYNNFVVGIERSKMRFYDVDESESRDLIENNLNKDIETHSNSGSRSKFSNLGGAFSDEV